MQNASCFTKIDGTSPFTHLWSLAVEMQFYLIWPALFLGYAFLERRIRKAWLLWVFLAGVSAAALLLNLRPQEDPSRVYYGTDTRISAILIRVLCGMEGRRKRPAPYRLSRCFCRLYSVALI